MSLLWKRANVVPWGKPFFPGQCGLSCIYQERKTNKMMGRHGQGRSDSIDGDLSKLCRKDGIWPGFSQSWGRENYSPPTLLEPMLVLKWGRLAPCYSGLLPPSCLSSVGLGIQPRPSAFRGDPKVSLCPVSMGCGHSRTLQNLLYSFGTHSILEIPLSILKSSFWGNSLILCTSRIFFSATLNYLDI